jgi:hypothetical protein
MKLVLLRRRAVSACITAWRRCWSQHEAFSAVSKRCRCASSISKSIPFHMSPYLLYPSTDTGHLIPHPLQCRTSCTVDPKPPALDPTPFGLKSIPYPCVLHSKNKLQSTIAPPPLPLHLCSFSLFASLSSSQHSDASPCSRSTPLPAPPPVPPLSLCLFSLFRLYRRFLLHNRRLHHEGFATVAV